MRVEFRSVLKSLEQYLDDSPTVSGKKVLQIAKEAVVRNKNVIRSLQDPVSQAGGLKILSGLSWGLGRAVVKCAAVAQAMWKHTGPARVFDGEEQAMKAILARHEFSFWHQNLKLCSFTRLTGFSDQEFRYTPESLTNQEQP